MKLAKGLAVAAALSFAGVSMAEDAPMGSPKTEGKMDGAKHSKKAHKKAAKTAKDADKATKDAAVKTGEANDAAKAAHDAAAPAPAAP